MFSTADFAGFLRERRKVERLTQAEFAQRAGIAFRSYQRIEAGDTRVRLSTFLRAFAAFGYELRPTPARRPTLDELDAIYGNEPGG